MPTAAWKTSPNLLHVNTSQERIFCQTRCTCANWEEVMFITCHEIQATHGFSAWINNWPRQAKQANSTIDVQLIAKAYPKLPICENDLFWFAGKAVCNLSLIELQASTMRPFWAASHLSCVITPLLSESIWLKRECHNRRPWGASGQQQAASQQFGEILICQTM